MEPQISTTQEQSARLIACGVSFNTADMTLSHGKGDIYELMATTFHYGCFDEKDLPAWSLSALLSLLPPIIKHHSQTYRLVMGPHGSAWDIEYNDATVTHNIARSSGYSPIESCVQMIEWLTRNKYKLNSISE